MRNIPVVPTSYLERFSRNSAIISAWRNYDSEVLAYLDRNLGSSVQQMTQQSAIYSNHIWVVKLMVDKMQDSYETYSGLA